MTGMLIIAALAASSSLAKAQPVTVTLSEWKVGLGRDTVRAGSATVTLKPGTYEVFCPMSDLSHKAAGMS
jgi:hypothetical protein